MNTFEHKVERVKPTYVRPWDPI